MNNDSAHSKKVIKTLIVDDESPARKRIRELLEDRNDFEISGECSNGEDAVNAINTKSFDLVFLDIELQDMNGFEVLEKLQNDTLPIIVFVTAYDKYALKAFEFHAIDYLLKPFDDERFDEMLNHVQKQFNKNQMEDLGGKLNALLSDYKNLQNQGASEISTPIYQKRIVLKSTGKISFIEIEDIDWIGAEGYYVNLNIDNKSHLMRETLKNLEKILDPQRFLRIHRSTIVNLTRIKEMQPSFHGEYVVILKDGKRLKLSRNYREQLEKLLDGKL